jgi:hypothetical protein
MKEVTTPEKTESSYVSQECLVAYVSAEIKIPNTLTAVGPYVGHAALKSLQAETDLKPALKYFANTYSFSREQMEYSIKAAMNFHHKFGVPVFPEGGDVAGKDVARMFKQERFEIVYKEGVLNILESILRLHGLKNQKDQKDCPLEDKVAEFLEHPDKLATTIAVFAAAERAIHTAASTEKSEAFKEQFNFIRSGEKPRAMKPEEKDAIQAEVMPFIIAAIKTVLAEIKQFISEEQLQKFVFVLTSPELYHEPA